jgi:hypothetical protein
MFLYELFYIYAESVKMLFVAKNNYIFVPNFSMLSLYAKIYPWWINHNFIYQKYLFLKYA